MQKAMTIPATTQLTLDDVFLTNLAAKGIDKAYVNKRVPDPTK